MSVDKASAAAPKKDDFAAGFKRGFEDRKDKSTIGQLEKKALQLAIRKK